MPRLPDIAPPWVAAYTGIDFAERGRTRAQGLDCWGLVRLVHAERFGIDLPSFDDGYTSSRDRDGTAAIVASQLEREPRWTLVEHPAVGDVPLYRIAGRTPHVGVIVARNLMLHARAGTASCLERMDAPGWLPRLVGVYRYTGPVVLRGRSRPMSQEVIDARLPEGLTVEQMLAAAGVPTHAGISVTIGHRLVPRARWSHVKPRAGRVVTVAVAPMGGDRNNKVLRIVLTIAVIAAAIIVPGLLVAAGYLVAGGIGASLVGAGIAIGGSLLVNALIPVSKPRLSELGADRGVSATITGARNESHQYNVVPVVLGKHRIAPPYAAAPYTEQIGDQQYLRLLFAVGYGPLYLRNLKIGETPVTSLRDVEIQKHNGYVNDRKLTLYPGTVHEESLSIFLRHSDGWSTRTTQTDTEEITVDVNFPQGLMHLDREGNRGSATVAVDVEYRETGSSTWLRVNGDGTSGSPTTEHMMDFLTREPLVTKGGTATHTGRISWSAGANLGDAKPGYLPTTKFCWVAEGYVYAPTTGTYTFALDSTDASDITVADTLVSSWYGQHPHAGSGGVPDYTNSTNTAITLTAGWHPIRVRMERRTNVGGGVAVGWKKPGDSDWITIPGTRYATSADGATGTTGKLDVTWYDFSAFGSRLTVSATQSDAVRRSVSWAVPRGQYDVRVERYTADVADTTDSTTLDDVYWTALRSINLDEPVRLQGVARVAMRIRATDQLNGVVDTFNLEARSVLRDYDVDTDTWVERATNNPASHFRAVLQGPANKRPLPDSRIDIDALETWHGECVTNGWEFNFVYDSEGTLRERLLDICAAGRASIGMRDGKRTVIRDRLQTTPVQLFTPRNSSAFEMAQEFPDRPHALKVTFLNENTGWQEDQRIVPADGYGVTDRYGIRRDAFGNVTTDPEATRIETIEAPGMTSPDQVWKYARYNIAVAQLRPRSFSLRTDIEHLACGRGDLVRITNDVMGFGIGSARIAGVTIDGDNRISHLQLDASVTLGSTDDYLVRVRLSDGTHWLKAIVRTPGEVTELELETPQAIGAVIPMPGDLCIVGTAARDSVECIVRSISAGADLSATLDLVDAAPAVHDADTGEIPAFVSGVTTPPATEFGPEAPAVESIRSDDYVMRRNPDGSLSPRMVLTLAAAASGSRPPAAFAVVRIRDVAGAGSWTTKPSVPISARQINVDDVEQGVTYQIAVRTLTATGEASVWTDTWSPSGTTIAIEHTVIGRSLPPPDPVSIAVSEMGDATRRVSWDLGTIPPDVVGARLRYGTAGQTWDDMTDLSAGTVASSPADYHRPGAGTWRFAVKAIDSTGLLSTNAAYVDKTLTRDADIVASSDERALGWSGTKTRCAVSSGDLAANALPTWADLSTWSSFIAWDQAAIFVYETAAVDGGAVFDLIPDATAAGSGTIALEVAWSVDGSSWSSWTDVATARASTHHARYVKSRATVSPTAGAHTPALTAMSTIVRNPA